MSVDDPVQVIQIATDDAPTVVYVPGSGAGVSDAELDTALEPYATKIYVDTVASGGSLDAVADLIDTRVAEHRNSPTPHPAYDDHPSLTLRFLNGLV